MDARDDPRLVTLVVEDPRGELEPFEVEVPWWQEVTPVVAAAQRRFGVTVTVLRLLEAVGPFPGGPVTYLVEAPDIDTSLLSATSHEPAPDANRAHYAHVGSPSRLLSWAEAELRTRSIEPVGQPSQVRTWNLAATWAIETTSGRVWLKATPPFLEHEAAVLEHLQSSGLVPPLVSGEPGKVLMHHVDGTDGFGIGGDAMQDAVDALLRIQASVDVAALATVPRMNRTSFGQSLEAVSDRWSAALDPDERGRLDRLRSELPDRFSAVSHAGESLVHGDFHGGNLRLRPGAPPVVLDWGDSFIGSPLFDVYALESYGVDGAEAIRRHWLDRLGASRDDWHAFRPIAAMLLPLVYQRFCDSIEASELPYHESDILPSLRASLASL